MKTRTLAAWILAALLALAALATATPHCHTHDAIGHCHQTPTHHH